MEELRSLVIQACSGDVEAFERLVRRFQGMAYGYAYSILGDFQLAEDVAQESFVEAYRQLSRLRVPEAFPSWFRRIVFKYCDRVIRRKRLETVPLDAPDVLVMDDADPACVAEQRDMAEKAMEAVRALPEHQRTVTTLFYINGYSQREVAEFLDVPVTTVKKRLHDSRRKLREMMMNILKTAFENNALPENFAQRLLRFPFPRHEPSVEIIDCPNESFEVRCADTQCYFVPLTENGKCDWPFYDWRSGCPTGVLTGVYEYHVVDTGRWQDGTLFRAWSRFTDFQENDKQEWNEEYFLVKRDRYQRVLLKRSEDGRLRLAEYIWPGDPECPCKPVSMRLKIGAKWEGCEQNEVVGVSQVTIGERSWKCLKIVTVEARHSRDPNLPVTCAEWYVAETGRTVFFRRYNGLGYREPDKPTSFESLAGNLEVGYQGITFRHFYDCIPDIAFDHE